MLFRSRIVDTGFDFTSLNALDTDAAIETLAQFPGVGPKIANCVLLFGCGRLNSIPVDVWIARGLREIYFRGRDVPLPKLQRFAEKRFGPYAGYAQQYLFHHLRSKKSSRGLKSP